LARGLFYLRSLIASSRFYFSYKHRYMIVV